jgi:hypothetical protein
MKQLITLSILLLAGPSFASAQTFNATSGSMIDQYLGVEAPYAVAGPDFSASGAIDYSGFPENP